jgi:hypothetical protein
MDYEKKIKELEEQILSLKKSYYRDMADQWTYMKDIQEHPVTGYVGVVEAEKLLFEAVASKCRGR